MKITREQIQTGINPNICGLRVHIGEDERNVCGFTKSELTDVFYRLTASNEFDYMLLESPSLDDVDCFYNPGDEVVDAAFILEAITVSRYSQTDKRMLAVVRVFNRFLKSSEFGIMAQEPIIGKPKKSGLFAYVTVQIPFSDGQVVSMVFHSPEGDKKKIGPDDALIAFRWLLNKRDITHVVAPENGKDVDLMSVGKRITQLIEKNHDRFVATQKKAKDEVLKLEELTNKTVELEESNIEISTRVVDTENLIEKTDAKIANIQKKIDTQTEKNSNLEAEISALNARKSAKAVGGNGDSGTDVNERFLNEKSYLVNKEEKTIKPQPFDTSSEALKSAGPGERVLKGSRLNRMEEYQGYAVAGEIDDSGTGSRLKLNSVLVEWKPRFKTSVPPEIPTLAAKIGDEVFRYSNPDMLALTASVTFQGKSDPGAMRAKTIIEQIKGAQADGYEVQRVKYRGSTFRILVKDGYVLTNAEASKYIGGGDAGAADADSVADVPETTNQPGEKNLVFWNKKDVRSWIDNNADAQKSDLNSLMQIVTNEGDMYSWMNSSEYQNSSVDGPAVPFIYEKEAATDGESDGEQSKYSLEAISDSLYEMTARTVFDQYDGTKKFRKEYPALDNFIYENGNSIAGVKKALENHVIQSVIGWKDWFEKNRDAVLTSAAIDAIAIQDYNDATAEGRQAQFIGKKPGKDLQKEFINIEMKRSDVKAVIDRISGDTSSEKSSRLDWEELVFQELERRLDATRGDVQAMVDTDKAKLDKAYNDGLDPKATAKMFVPETAPDDGATDNGSGASDIDKMTAIEMESLKKGDSIQYTSASGTKNTDLVDEVWSENGGNTIGVKTEDGEVFRKDVELTSREREFGLNYKYRGLAISDLRKMYAEASSRTEQDAILKEISNRIASGEKEDSPATDTASSADTKPEQNHIDKLNDILSGAYDDDLESLEREFEAAITALSELGLDEQYGGLIEQVSNYYTDKLTEMAKGVS